MRRIVRRIRADDGFSIVELMTSVALLTLVPIVFGSTIITIQRAVNTASGRSQKNDAAQLAIAEIDRQIRSGNVFYDPASESDATNGIVAGQALRVYTQANAPTNTPAYRCVQWRVNTSNQLQTRWWAPAVAGVSNYAGSVTSWRTVVDDVVNRTTSPAVSAFALVTPVSGTTARTIQVRILTDRSDDQSSTPQEIKASITGRNTQFNYSSTACSYP
jgi:Tfp pilus assembly protein PilW